ncbi:NAD-dependent epimerase/dehydratase family protein [Candidatus Margulisiibacteriota bacterium]
MGAHELLNNYAGKRVLITGGLGLMGSNLSHKLLDYGAKVTILDPLLPLYGGNLFNFSGIEDKVTINYGDIRDEAALAQTVKDKDIIFNLAAQVSYTDGQTDPLLDLDINCRGHLLLLESCRKFNPSVKIVFSGSRLQYGEVKQVPVNEDQPMNPKSFYGIHKVAGEFYHKMYYKLHGIRTAVFRIANPYGIRHQMKHSRYGIVNYFIKLAMGDDPIKIFGDGNQIRDYIYVEDIVEAFLHAGIRQKADNEVFNVGSGTPTRFVDMAKTVIATVGKGRLEMVPWPENYQIIESGGYVSDIAKAKKMLAWSPKTKLSDGIKKTFEYYLKYKDHYWGQGFDGK